ncbi:MAG: NADH:flavin oxidoreductase [Deltaproteobacteria bacterium]|nr:NADH:flavin oxidoreductase [Deltaproteobacteria bacterium]
MTKLKDSLTINGMQIQNRMVLPPLTTNYGSPDGHVTDNVIAFYTKRAKDVGLVIVEAASVREDGRIVAGSLGLWDDDHISGMTRLADAIQSSGAAAVVQINHAGARCFPSGGDMQGASPSAFAFRPDVEPMPMSQEQIDTMVADFASAAVRARDAGFDGVEIHGAHLYLISQFLSPLTNRRTDRYGGDARARATFALEVIDAVREKVGKAYPVLFRLNAVEYVDGGQPLRDALEISQLLKNAGVDALNVSLISQGSWREVDGKALLAPASAFPKDEAFGANMNRVKQIKDRTGLPVIGVGKMGDEDTATRAVANGMMDMVAVGRQMIADPDSAGKILSGKGDDIIPCQECMACFKSLGKGIPLTCKVNKELPGAAKEK